MPFSPWSNLPIRTKGLLLALPTLIAVGVVAWLLPEAIREASHRFESIRELQNYQQLQQRLLRSAIDAETGARGFALTQDGAFLQNYDEAIAELPALLEEANARAAATGVGLELIGNIENEATRRVEQLLLVVQSTQIAVPGLREELPALFQAGRQTMEDLRMEMAALDEATRLALEVEREALDQLRGESLILLFSALGVIALCTLIFGGIYQVSVARRISQLEERTRFFAEETPGSAAERPRGDEISGLDYSFSNMAQRVEAREQEMAEAAEHLEGVLQSISEAFIATDHEWRITYLNPRAMLLLNVTREEAMHTIFWELAPDLVGGESRMELERGVESGQPLELRMPAPKSDPDLPMDARPEFDVKAYPSEAGVAMLWQEAGQDDADRMRRAFLRERQTLAAREQAIVETALDAIFSLDAQGKFLEVNPAAERLWGGQASRYRNQSVNVVVQPEHHEILWQAIRAALAGERQKIEVLCETNEGQDLPMLWSLMASPDRSQVFCVAHDISTQKQAEREILQARDNALDQAEARSDLLLKVGQELRTPLNGLLGMEDLCLDSELDEKQREYLTLMRESTMRLQHIVEGLANFTHSRAGVLDLHSAPCALGVEVEQCALEHWPRMSRKGLRLFIQIQPDYPSRVRVDGRRIRQILNTLLDQAVEKTNAGSIEVRLEGVGAEGDRLITRLSVRDSSGGDHAEEATQWTAQGAQAEPETSATPPTSALAMSRQLANLLGGTLGSEGQAGVGSLFWLELPMELVNNTPFVERRPDLSDQTIWAAVRSPAYRDTLREWGSWLKMSVEVELSRHLVAGSISRRIEANQAPAILIFETALVATTEERKVAAALESHLGKGGRVVAIGSPFASLTRLQAHYEQTIRLAEPVLMEGWQRLFGVGGDDEISQRLPALEAARHSLGNPQALLIEDDDVQQKIAQAAFMQMGCDFEICETLAEAGELLRSRSFDLILLDLSLPYEDSYKFARERRRTEQAEGSQAVVIVGMTSRARHLDLPICREAGMNDCLSKPISDDEMIRVMGEHSQFRGRWTAQPIRRQGSPILFDRLQDLHEGDEVSFRTMLEAFDCELPDRIASISHALAQHDAADFREQVEQLHAKLDAHDCQPAAAIARRLMLVESSTLWLRGEKLLRELTSELEAVRRAIQERLEDKRPVS